MKIVEMAREPQCGERPDATLAEHALRGRGDQHLSPPAATTMVLVTTTNNWITTSNCKRENDHSIRDTRILKVTVKDA